jgi:hypothetical protein
MLFYLLIGIHWDIMFRVGSYTGIAAAAILISREGIAEVGNFYWGQMAVVLKT